MPGSRTNFVCPIVLLQGRIWTANQSFLRSKASLKSLCLYYFCNRGYLAYKMLDDVDTYSNSNLVFLLAVFVVNYAPRKSLLSLRKQCKMHPRKILSIPLSFLRLSTFRGLPSAGSFLVEVIPSCVRNSCSNGDITLIPLLRFFLAPP